MQILLGARPQDAGVRSISLWNQHLRRYGLAEIVLVVLALWQDDRLLVHLRVRELLQKMIDAIQAGALLVDGVHYPPARFGNV